MPDNSTPFVRPAAAATTRPVSAGKDASMQVLLGPEEGAPNFVLRRFTMQIGGGMPLHTNEVEHEQYVLRGRARITIGGEVHQVGPDHTLYIPAGAPHSYEVVEGPFEFLCIVPNAPDKVTVLDSC